jgi:Ca2+/Na+ antiporter
MKLLAYLWKFFRTLHGPAARDSVRNVLAVLGLAAVLADFSTMRLWMVLPCACLLFVVWLIDYERHFRGESAEESLTRDLARIRRESEAA